MSFIWWKESSDWILFRLEPKVQSEHQLSNHYGSCWCAVIVILVTRNLKWLAIRSSTSWLRLIARAIMRTCKQWASSIVLQQVPGDKVEWKPMVGWSKGKDPAKSEGLRNRCFEKGSRSSRLEPFKILGITLKDSVLNGFHSNRPKGSVQLDELILELTLEYRAILGLIAFKWVIIVCNVIRNYDHQIRMAQSEIRLGSVSVKGASLSEQAEPKSRWSTEICFRSMTWIAKS